MFKQGDLVKNRYHILNFSESKFVKDGGMGFIYLAHDLELNRKVVLKRNSIDGEWEKNALINEIETLKNLSHPGILDYIDSFTIDDNHILVVEFIDGENLYEIFNSFKYNEGKGVKIEKLFDWGIEVLKILEYLHSYVPPIIHRDIKPQNIMMDKNGQIKLIDFGISKRTFHTDVDGKSPWSPPEQYNSQGTTIKSDIFSLGSTLYLLATGTLATPSKYRLQMTNDKLPDLLCSVSSLNPQISEKLSKIIMKSMELDPNNRFKTASEMKNELLEEYNRLFGGLAPTEPSPSVQKPTIVEVLPIQSPQFNPVPPTNIDYNQVPIVITPNVNTAEMERIRFLESKDTNFIFTFGKPGTGKTTVTASLIYYLSLRNKFGVLEKIGNEDGKMFATRIENEIEKGLFPSRTANGSIFELDCRFIPNSTSPNSKCINFTFLDMNGEDLVKVSSQETGEFPSNIDVFFKSGKISMTFVLVVSVDSLSENDKLMSEFIDYIRAKLPILKEGRILLLVSKWDKINTSLTIEYLLRKQMPETFKRLNPNVNSYGHFTLGVVVEDNKGLSKIHKYESSHTENVFKWLFETITGKRLN